MKISYNWLKDYIDINQKPEELSKLLTMTGLEVEGLDEYEPVKGGLEGLVVGKIITCEDHPNADKLKITTVDLGNGESPQIICGAPNVKKGQKVIVAPVGTTLYPTKGDPFKIKKAKIRGAYSEGMICSEDEIGLGTDHDGIVVLDSSLPVGDLASKHFDLQKDYIFEIGLTPNRADATSHIGVARDIRAINDNKIKWPSVENFKVDNNDLKIPVEVKNTDACPRYSALTITGVEIKKSPDWLQKKLKSVGLSPINNIVDITNFVMLETGQPLHAFDADKIKNKKVVVQTLKEGTTFITLDEEKRKLKDHDLMICDENDGMCIAGVFGGIDSGITEKTRNIFLESAYFSPDYIRRTAQYHDLKTDASFRFERGTDPNITVYALKRAAILMKELGSGMISSEIVDVYPKKINDFKVQVKFSHIDRLIGKKIPKEDIFKILNSLEIKIERETKEGIMVLVPPYRVDVTREADVIEEILRIYGFNNVELPDKLSTSALAEFPEIDDNKIQNKIARFLSGRGFHEIWTNSLTKPDYITKLKEFDEKDSVEILNKLSEDLGVLRQTLLFSGLEAIRYNINRKQFDLKFFEFGTVYFKNKSGYRELKKLALFMTGNKEKENWINPVEKVKFQDMAEVVHGILNALIRKDLKKDIFINGIFNRGLKITSGNNNLCKLGEVNPDLLKEMEIKEKIFYAELDWDLLLKNTNDNIVFDEISRFPEVRRDLSLVIDKEITFEEIKGITLDEGTHLIKEMNVFDVYEGENIGKNKKAYAISFILQDKEKTLTDKAIDNTMNKLMTVFEKKLGATIRK